ncbi:MAG: hypothetical protein M3030_04650, partial [Bombella apis]|nr:hypothetical protein [Bombella apis]
NKLNVATLTQREGYLGVNGLFHLRPDGRMIRALGIYQIAPGGGSQLIVPASRDLTSPSSLSIGPVVSGRRTASASADMAVWSPAKQTAGAVPAQAQTGKKPAAPDVAVWSPSRHAGAGIGTNNRP